MKITKNTSIGDLLDEYPESLKIIQKYMGNVGCITCPGRAMETLEMGAIVHGVDEKDFKKMMNALKKKFAK